jgi:hypothetical protein
MSDINTRLADGQPANDDSRRRIIYDGDCSSRCHPRTMNEAFGPYTSGSLQDAEVEKTSYDWPEWLALGVSAACAVLLGYLHFAGLLP